MRVRASIVLWLGCLLTALVVAAPGMAAAGLRFRPAHRNSLPSVVAPLTHARGIGHTVARAAIAAAGQTVSVGALPTGVAVSNTRAYVDNSQGNSVSVVDLTTHPASVTATIPVGLFPDGVALSPDGSTAYVSNFRGATLSIINTAANTVTKTVQVGTDPEGVVQIGSRVYVANFLSHSISVVDPVAGIVVGTIPLTHTPPPAPDPSGVATNGDGTHLYVDDSRNGLTDVIDLSHTPLAQEGSAAVGTFPAYLVINGTTGYVANATSGVGAGTVSVVDDSDPAHPAVTHTVTVGSHPFGVALLPSQGEVLAANSGDGTVSVIDGSTNAVVRTLGVGRTPDAVAVTPDQSTAVVTNEGDNTISILRGPVVGSVNFTGAVGNTAFGVGTSPARPSTSTSGTVLSNSSDPNGGTLTAHPGTIATAHGGSVAMNADGTFTYHPGAGFTGVDSFPFTVSNGIATASSTAQITVAHLVWYVNDSSAANGTGTSTSPFNALSSVTGPAGPTSSGDTLFLFGSATAYGGGIALKADQLLIGQSATLTVGGETVSTASGANPKITNTGGTGITLATGDTVTGITVANTSGTGVSATAISTFTLSSGDTISGAGGDGLDVIGGSGTVSALATITGAAGHSVSIQGRTGGTTTFGAAITEDGTGIMLAGNTGATIDFSGPITASTGSHPAFRAAGGGTVNVAGATNTLATTTADALDVENTTIGSAGLTFESISAGTSTGGPLNGILLRNTGATGPLTVTGVGATTGSGGTIQHATDATELGGEVALDTTGPVSLSNMEIDHAAVNGIGAHELSSLTLLGNHLNGSGTVDQVPGDGISYVTGTFDASTDTSSGRFDIAGNHVTGMAGSDVFVYSGSSGTVTGHVTGNVIGTAGSASGSTAGEGIDVFSDSNGGTVTADVSDNTVTGIATSNGILGAAQDNVGGTTRAPTLNLTLTGNNVDLASTTATDGINVSSGSSPVTGAPPPPLPAAVCLNATSNTSVSQGLADPNNLATFDADGMSVYQVTDASVFKIVGGPDETEPNPSGTTVEDPLVENFLDTANPGLQANSASDSQPSIALQFGAAGFTSATSCPTAPAPALSPKAAAMVKLLTVRPTAGGGRPAPRSSRTSADSTPVTGRRRHGARSRHAGPPARAARRRAAAQQAPAGAPG